MFTLTLNNFRGFKSETFDFSRVNILIGENSSGKSSILKFLLALKQSFERPNNLEANLTLSGEYVDLGNYAEIINNHDTMKNLSFSFGFKDHYEYFEGFVNYFFSSDEENEREEISALKKSLYDKALSRINFERNTEVDATIHIELTSQLDKHKASKVILENINLGKLYILFPEKEKSIDRLISNDPPKCILKFCKNDGSVIEIANVECDENAFLTLIRQNSLREQIELQYKDDEEIESIFWNIAYLLIIQNHLTFILDKIDFVNPIHSKPERFYYEKDKRSIYKTNDIDKLVNLISKKNFPIKFLEDFYKIISDYGLAQGIDITTDNKLPVKELRVQINDLWNNITDVGYAVSLQLPIIFQAYLAEQSNDNILLIEQPEVHLHPRLQAMFIETLLKLGKNNIYFIETHSEYIIRKLQILIKENSYGVLSKDVTINYLSNKNTQSSKSVHQILKNGRLSPPLPSTFFDNSYELAIRLLD